MTRVVNVLTCFGCLHLRAPPLWRECSGGRRQICLPSTLLPASLRLQCCCAVAGSLRGIFAAATIANNQGRVADYQALLLLRPPLSSNGMSGKEPHPNSSCYISWGHRLSHGSWELHAWAPSLSFPSLASCAVPICPSSDVPMCGSLRHVW